MKPKFLKVTELGNPILRRKAKKITQPLAADIQNLIPSMMLTMKKSAGIGIAAPQVGKSLRLFIVESAPTPAYPKAPRMKPIAIINPRIITKSPQKKTDWEGCLSIPGIFGLVPRHASIEVEYTNNKGVVTRQVFKDLAARVFQHEFDHINGVLFTDRAKAKSLITAKELMKLLKAKKK